MDSLRAAREKEEKAAYKPAKDSNFDDILGTSNQDDSPLESSNRKRAGPDDPRGLEPAKRSRVEDNQTSSRLPPIGDYYAHNGFGEWEAGRRPMAGSSSTHARLEANYSGGSGPPSNEYSVAPQSRGEVTPLRSPESSANRMQAFLLPEGRAQEAMQLIGYHLTKLVLLQDRQGGICGTYPAFSSYRQNNDYVLPPSLRPTPLQRNLEHGRSAAKTPVNIHAQSRPEHRAHHRRHHLSLAPGQAHSTSR